MPIMPRPSEKAKKIHRAVMPIQYEDPEKQSRKKREKEDRQITIDIQQNISR